MALGDVVRRLVITLDRDAAERLRDEAAKAVGEAGQEGAQQFAEAMDDGGRRAARELLRALQDEHRRTIAHARIDLAKGLIDTSRFREIAAEADRQFNARLIEGMERLRSEGKLTEHQFVSLANRLKNVGDTGEREIRRVDAAFERLRGVAIRAGAALASIFALRSIVQFGQDAIRTAIDAGEVWGRLAGTLANVGVAFEDVQDEIAAAARRLQDLTTVGDEDFAAILQTLVRITGDYQLALDNVALVADVAAGAQLDLQSAAQLVGRVLIGDTSLLRRYGIVVQENADAVQALRDRFGGLAENEASTLSGRLRQLANEWGDLKEAIGNALIAAGGGTSILDTLIGVVKGLAQFIAENEAQISKWGRVLLLTLRAAAQSLVTFVRVAYNRFQIIISSLQLFLLESRRMLDRFLNYIADVVNAIIEGLNRIPGVNIEFRMNQRDPERFAAQIAAVRARIEKDALDVADALRDLAEAWLDVGRAALGSADMQRKAFVAPRPIPQQRTPERRPGGLFDEPERGLEQTLQMREMPLVPVDIAAERERALEWANEWLAAHALLQASAENTAFGIANAFRDAFDSLLIEGEGVGEAFENIFRGISASALGGLAQYAGGKVAENIAAAFEAHARGLAFAANPFLAPLAAGQFAAAKAHLAAAAKWAIIGGLAGAVQGAIGGASRGANVGGLPSGAANPADRLLDRANRAQTEVHVYINPLDPSDPVYQRNVMAASQLARERFGSDAVVHVHPFPARRA